MKVYLAALENSCDYIYKDMPADYLQYGLVSYFYLKGDEHLQMISHHTANLLVDSGAHSFQHGKKIDYDAYTKEYAEFVARHTNNPKIVGFFEMDIDNVVGYDKVLEYRKMLEAVSDKIIPVWHNNRGIADFYAMCEQYKNRRIAITGFANNDITDGQYNLFINVAHKFNCKIHVLGLTRYELIQSLNLGKDDSVDSSSWKQAGIFGGINLPDKDKKIFKLSSLEGLKVSYKVLIKINFVTAKALQEMYLDLDNRVIYEQ